MIKVCSLEFLNKSSFEADVMLSDGRVLFNAGSEITPEILLKLYYKDIYVEKSLCKAAKSAAALKHSQKENEEVLVGVGITLAASGEVSPTGADLKPAGKDGEGSAEGVELKTAEKAGELNSELSADVKAEEVDLKAVKKDGEGTSELVDLDAVIRDEDNPDSEDYTGTTPKVRFGGRRVGDNKVATSAIIGPKSTSEVDGEVVSDSDTEIQAKVEAPVDTEIAAEAEAIDSAEAESDEDLEGEVDPVTGKRIALSARKAGGAVPHKQSTTHKPSEPIEVVPPKDTNGPLEFNEEQAQRVSALSVRLAKILSMDLRQQDDVKQAAYYHNIGRTKLKQSDLTEPDFKKRQAVAGYNHILNNLALSPKIAEAAMFYNKKYQSSELNLNSGKNSDFPYSHIVAITNYYDDLISDGLSQNATLMKMLQLGGNKFNVFILHKFINMVRK